MNKTMGVHYPVMLKEVLDICIKSKFRTVIDCTFGCGGHSKAILDENFKVLAIDRDPSALQYSQNIKNSNFKFYQGKFASVIKTIPLDGKLVFADLGTCMAQLESSKRGFSYKEEWDGPLFMTMGEDEPLYKQLHRMDFNDIEKILRDGEFPGAHSMTTRITNFRLTKQIMTSQDLVKASGLYDYKKLSILFQAFRIYVNRELDQLSSLLNYLIKFKAPFIIISFHSLEKKIIRRYKKYYDNYCCLNPSLEELKKNPGSRSAILHYCYNN